MGQQLQNQNRMQWDASLHLCGPGTVIISPPFPLFSFLYVMLSDHVDNTFGIVILLAFVNERLY